MRRRKKAKYQLSLGIEEAASLDDLQRETEASSRSEVVREALALYRHVVDGTKKGGAIAIQNADGTTAQVAFRGMEVVRRAFASQAGIGGVDLRGLPGDAEADARPGRNTSEGEPPGSN